MSQNVTNVTIRVAGVPEHFNAPFHIAKERGLFAALGIDLQWTDYSTGTGAMVKALSENKEDLAVLLTEGAIADITNGSHSKILGTYVSSPLCWGVHCKADSQVSSIAQLKGKNFGVSRLGSGSHMMAYVMGQTLGWNPQNGVDVPLKIVTNLDGARAAMAKGEIEAFMWEKFTTKHVCESGEWKRVGEFHTPWPCFVVAGREAFLREHSELVAHALQAVYSVCKEIKANQAAWVPFFASTYKNTEEDAAVWLGGVEWCEATHGVSEGALGVCGRALVELGLVKQTPTVEGMVYPLPDTHTHTQHETGTTPSSSGAHTPPTHKHAACVGEKETQTHTQTQTPGVALTVQA